MSTDGIKELADGASGAPELEAEWAARATEACQKFLNSTEGHALIVGYYREIFRLFKKKQHDYGPMNIGIFQEKGVVIRCTDKMSRLKQAVMDGVEMGVESERDTWLDLADYGIIGLMCHDGVWPKFEIEELFGLVNYAGA